MRTEIYDGNIILKAYEKSFAPLLFEAALESGASAEFRRWMPWCHENYTIGETHSFIEKTTETWRNSEDIWRKGMEFGYAIFDAASGTFLGGTGLNQPNETHKFYNLGYWVRTGAQKQRAFWRRRHSKIYRSTASKFSFPWKIFRAGKPPKKPARIVKAFCAAAFLSAAKHTTRRFSRSSAKTFRNKFQPLFLRLLPVTVIG